MRWHFPDTTILSPGEGEGEGDGEGVNGGKVGGGFGGDPGRHTAKLAS